MSLIARYLLGDSGENRSQKMDKRDDYQRIECLQEDDQHPSDCRQEALSEVTSSTTSRSELDDDEYREADLFPSSPMSSSPPNDFDVNMESQYIPIYGDDLSPHRDHDHLQQSSRASSPSIASDHDRTTSGTARVTSTCRLIRCPACEKPMRTFYCAKCIQKGHFVTLDSPYANRFTETHIRPTTIYENNIDEEPIEPQIDEQKVLKETLQIKLRTLTKKTEALQNLYDDQKLRLEETKKLLKETKHKLELEQGPDKKQEKMNYIKKCISRRKSSIKKRREQEAELLEDVKQYVNRRVFQLTTDVFPMEEMNLYEQSTSFVNMETSPLLTFSDGSHHQIEQLSAYSIVEPWLPSNGDYSAYSLWVNDNKDNIPASMSDRPERNPAFRIGAGLAYTTQLVENLACYLDVILPARLDLSTFSSELLSDPQFSYNVAKLNVNVVHLCVSQGVDVSLLNPHRTLKNLMLLFNPNISDLGRKPVIELETNEEVANRMSEQLVTDLSLVQDKFYDFSRFGIDDEDEEDGESDSEWEISDTISPMDMPMQMQAQMFNEQSVQQASYIARFPRIWTSFWSSGS